jgi:hypothetical protein
MTASVTPTMTSADFCNIPPPSVYSFGYFFNIRSCLRQLCYRSLRVSTSAFGSCSHCIYAVLIRTVWGFCFLCNITHSTTPYMHFLFVGSNLCRQLLSDSQSPTTPLLLANTPYCKVCSGLAPYSWYTCLTHIKKGCPFETASFSLKWELIIL